LPFWGKFGKVRGRIPNVRLRVLEATEDEQPGWWGLFADGWSGLLCWLNLSGWTYDPRLSEKHRAFVTWPIQDEAVRELWKAIDGGHDVLLDKSRDTGATWLSVAALVWWWLFVPDTPLLMASRKEDYVDSRGNPDALFWKADYLVKRMPDWLRPRTERRHMHLAAADSGSVINGESTNSDLGRGGRRKAILLDEFAAVENGREILSATADATPCRIFNSTPKGRANAFADVRFSGKVRVITLHWKDHPVKGKDARLVTLDGKQRWTSPWYEAECARRTSRKEIAQELDIDYLASGQAFFDLDVCGRIRASGALRSPDHRGEIRFRVETLSEGRSYRLTEIEWASEEGRRRLSLWCPLAPDAGGAFRPPQLARYVAFADVSHGTGSSNSVIKVASVDAAEEVASFVCPDTPPHELAHHAVAICTWFGGRNGYPFLGWEANGPGGIFGLEVLRLGYPYALRAPNLDLEHRPEDPRMGWFSTRRSKENLLGDLRRAMARGEVTFHEGALIAEAEQYVYYPSGAVGPAGLVAETDGARSAHGDRVIAAAGVVLCLAEQPRTLPPAGAPAPGSFADRREQFLREQRKRDGW